MISYQFVKLDMEEISPVAVTLSVTKSICDISGIASDVEIAEVKLITKTAILLPDPVEAIVGEVVIVEKIKEEDILLVKNKPNGIVSESSPIILPIAETVQIVAKVINLGENNMKRKLSDDVLTIAENFSNPSLSAAVVSIHLPTEKIPAKRSIKSVFELDYVPLWGSVSISGKMTEMEDAVAVVPHFMKVPIKMLTGGITLAGTIPNLRDPTAHLFGVYDGHGGSQVANFCRERVHLALAEELEVIKDDLMRTKMGETPQIQWENVFKRCFKKVDEEVGKGIAPETVGSTAVVSLICASHIIVANTGDSRAVLNRGKEALPLSIDHKPNREDECARIEAAGGKVIQWNGARVCGVLAMSRSIGDRYLKPWIIAEPEVMFLARAKEDECLILASDGLWDVMTNEEACVFARRRINLWHKKNNSASPSLYTAAYDGQGVDQAAQAAAVYLSFLALQRGSKDNISVVVVDLKLHRKIKNKT
jgi:protein phosphatase 2C